MIQIKKRDGKLEEFKCEKIEKAIQKAIVEVYGVNDLTWPQEISQNICAQFKNTDLTTVEEVQDLVEIELMKKDSKIAKAYIIYRNKRTESRNNPSWQLSELGKSIYENKYRLNRESFKDFLTRVSGGNTPIIKLMTDKALLPAGRILAGRGTHSTDTKVTLSNCFLAGHQVITKRGLVKIEDVQIGDYVITHDDTWQKVVNTMSHLTSKNIYQISVDTGEDVFCTEDHRFYTDKGWVEANKLTDHGVRSKIKIAAPKYENHLKAIDTDNNIYTRVKKITNLGPTEELVYNISVENSESYSVNGLVCHNCYVLPSPEDNLESIFDIAKEMARTYSWGGGVGITLSKLRPNKAKVYNAAKTTSGPVSFMDLYDTTTSIIGQHNRRGALMIAMDCTHPDILDFINSKTDLAKVTKANISVMISEDFMEAALENKEWELFFDITDTGERISKKVDANQLFHTLCKNNWDYAEPGILFWDRIKKWNLLSEDKNFEFAGINPCGSL